MVELKKGPWTREEDEKLLVYVQEHGHGSWRTLPAKAGLERCGKSCRMRWTNYLRPDIKRGKFSTQEEKTIIRLHALLGNRWSAISAHLPKRTDNEIKNYWNTRLKKRLTRMGIDPVTHKPKNNPCDTQADHLIHMAQWETVRLEAEARLVRKSKLLYNLQLLRKAAGSPPQPPPQPVVAPPCLDVLKVWQATATQNRFFSLLGSLESPTSTLNFYGNTCTVPTVDASSFIANDVMSMNGSSSDCGMGKVNDVADKGKMENLMPLHDNNIAKGLDYNYNYNMSGSMDFATSVNYNPQTNNMVGEIIGDLDDNRNYWMELLNLVGSPMGSPIFQV